MSDPLWTGHRLVSRQTATEAPYWQTHYVVETDPDEIAGQLALRQFVSGGRSFDLVAFEQPDGAPSVLISPGSSGHALLFAELAYCIAAHGYNVFIMPKQGGYTINALLARHRDAVAHIARWYGERIGVFGEGLGGYVTFYLALSHAPVTSIICQNAPAILTEPAFHAALLGDTGAAKRRRRLLPVVQALVRVLPKIPVPISLYLDFRELVDPKAENRTVEAPLIESYAADPDFDRYYPLDAVMSLLSTPPPRPLGELGTPTMFLVPVRGLFPAYVHDLYARLPVETKQLIEVDGSVFWMVSHPRQAARVIGTWFDQTVAAATKGAA